MSQPVPKVTGKRYRTTSEMLADTGVPQEMIDSVKEVEAQTTVPLLVAMRVSKGLTQKELAKAIGCSQGRISKLETGRDEDLRLRDLLDYTRATDGGLWITMVQPPKIVEHIKLHVRALRQLAEELVSLPEDDQAMKEGVDRVLDDYLFEAGRLVESCKKKLGEHGPTPSGKPELEIAVLSGGQEHRKRWIHNRSGVYSEPAPRTAKRTSQNN
jgi:transcriptional regulator with XRE-family HTH domain